MIRESQHFGIMYALLVIGQAVLCNYAALGPYITLSMLPAMVLCIPTSLSTISCMLIAFASGLAVDWMSEGIIGLNAAAIVPVALLRNWIIKIFMGEVHHILILEPFIRIYGGEEMDILKEKNRFCKK